MKLSNALTTTHLKHLNPIRNTGQGVLQKKRHLLSSSAHTVHVIAPGQYQVLWYTLYILPGIGTSRNLLGRRGKIDQNNVGENH